MHQHRNTIRLLLLGGFVVVALGALISCGKSSQDRQQPPQSKARTVEVMFEGRRVLTARNKPGPLRSTALPPSPEWKPPLHPFLSAEAHDPETESRLKAILDQSSDFDDYLKRLSEAGFQVSESKQ